MQKPKCIQKVVLPLSVMSWILGNGVIEYPLGRPRYVISFLYSLFILMAYGTALYYAIISDHYIYLRNVSKTGEILFKIIFYGNGVVAVARIILGWNRRKGLKKCLESIEVVDELLQKMGIPKNYDKTFVRDLRCIFIMLITFVCVITINSSVMFINEPPLYIKASYVVSAHYPIILIFFADMMFLSFVSHMRRKFRRLNHLLKSMSSTSPLSPQYMKLLYHRTGLMKPTGFDKKTNDDTLMMKAAKQIHFDLVKISRRINETFGLQILLSLALALIVITGILYCSYTIAYLPRKYGLDLTPGLICSCCWLFFYAMEIFVINHICDRTSTEALKTGNIICELHEPTTNKEFRLEIREFVLQLIQNPLKFTAHDFVSLDYTFIQGVVGSVTTYLVILIQLGGDISESKVINEKDVKEQNTTL